jgi:hypothetical protein
MSAKILFVNGIQEIIHHRPLPDKYEHSNSKNTGFQLGPKIKNDKFAQNDSYKFDSI